jgi:hypothetical protein
MVQMRDRAAAHDLEECCAGKCNALGRLAVFRLRTRFIDLDVERGDLVRQRATSPCGLCTIGVSLTVLDPELSCVEWRSPMEVRATRFA